MGGIPLSSPLGSMGRIRPYGCDVIRLGIYKPLRHDTRPLLLQFFTVEILQANKQESLSKCIMAHLYVMSDIDMSDVRDDELNALGNEQEDDAAMIAVGALYDPVQQDAMVEAEAPASQIGGGGGPLGRFIFHPQP